MFVFIRVFFVCLFFYFIFRDFLTKWRQRYFETQSIISPQAPAALLATVWSRIHGNWDCCPDWLQTCKVEIRNRHGCLGIFFKEHGDEVGGGDLLLMEVLNNRKLEGFLNDC